MAVPSDYIIELDKKHEKWLGESGLKCEMNIPILTIDCNSDFLNDEVATVNAVLSVKAFIDHLINKT